MYLYVCLGHLYSFPGLVWSALVLRGRKAYGPALVRILLQFQLRDIFKLAFRNMTWRLNNKTYLRRQKVCTQKTVRHWCKKSKMTDRWWDTCSWIGRIPKAIYRFNVNCYQITNGIFHRTRTKTFFFFFFYNLYGTCLTLSIQSMELSRPKYWSG